MKRLELYAATAIITLGVSAAAGIPAQASMQTMFITGNCFSNGNYLSDDNYFSCNTPNFSTCTSGNFLGNNGNDLQSILSSLSYSCPSTYSCPDIYSCSNPYSCNSNCDETEKYFPNQGWMQNINPGNNCSGNNISGNYFPNFNIPENNNQGNHQGSSQGNNNQNNSQGNNNQGSSQGNNNQSNNQGNHSSTQNSSNASYIQQIVNLVNEERAKAGLSPVTESSALSKAAYTRAQEITRSFSHTRPNGSYFSSILQQNGISFIHSGENIAYGQRTPQEVMNDWMNSASHRANILNKNYTTIGIGYYQDSNGTNYWAQLFIQ